MDKEKAREMKRPRLKGIFSLPVEGADGSDNERSYWKASELENGSVLLQGLDLHFVPKNDVTYVTRDELSSQYRLETELWFTLVSQGLVRGEMHRKARQFPEAQISYNKVIGVDEENVRAYFGLGLVYLEQNRDKNAREVFQKLLKLDEAFEPQHKHLFNEFGIRLRKQGLLKETLQYYFKAKSLADPDEHLDFNIARTYYELDDFENMFAYLRSALERNMLFEEGRKFLHFVLRNGVRPKDRGTQVFFKSIMGEVPVDPGKKICAPRTGHRIELNFSKL